tara:strand:+ start:362 stop:1018 length:657 start_codon:yes stop_codon:yes gene_type:complete
MATVTIYPEYNIRVDRLASGTWSSIVSGDGTSTSTTAHSVATSVIFTFGCSRNYFRFDTTSIPTGATITSADVKVYMHSTAGSNAAAEFHKLFKSDDLSSDDASLYQSITSTDADTVTDVGGSTGWKTFEVDGDLLTYLQTQVTAGNKTAVILRNQLDYGGSQPTGIESHLFYGLDDDDVSGEDYRPYLTVDYTVGTSVKLTLNSGKLKINSGKVTIG